MKGSCCGFPCDTEKTLGADALPKTPKHVAPAEARLCMVVVPGRQYELTSSRPPSRLQCRHRQTCIVGLGRRSLEIQLYGLPSPAPTPSCSAVCLDWLSSVLHGKRGKDMDLGVRRKGCACCFRVKYVSVTSQRGRLCWRRHLRVVCVSLRTLGAGGMLTVLGRHRWAQPDSGGWQADPGAGPWRLDRAPWRFGSRSVLRTLWA